MPEFLSEPYVIWFIIGFGLALAELAAPGFILIFFGLGCWTTSLVSALLDISLTAQIAVFIVSSVASLVLLRRVFMRIFTGTTGGEGTDEGLREPGDIGRSVTVTRDVSPGAPGEIKYRGSYWRAVSDVRIPAGSYAVIVQVFPEDRSTFKIEPSEQGE